MTLRTAVCALSLALVSISGCAQVERQAGMKDVRGLVTDRIGQDVQWHQEAAEDAAAAEAVHSLLERDLTADAAVQIALLNNRSLQGVYEELGIAQAELVQAGLLRNPVFEGEIHFGSAGASVELSLVQNFLRIFQIPLRKRLASAAFEAAKLRVAGSVIDLAGQTRRDFYAVLAANQRLELHRTVAAATAASYEYARRLHAAGNITDLDLAQERALHEEGKLDLAAGELEASAARERLNTVMGVWGPDTAWHTVPRLDGLEKVEEVESMAILEQRAIERSLDLGALRQDILVNAQRVGAARPLWLWDAEVGVAADRDTDGSWGIGPAISTPLPIFDQGGPARAIASGRWKQAHDRYIFLAVAVRAGVREMRTRVLATHDRAVYYQAIVLPLRRTITDETQKQFNAMQISAFQLLTAKRQEIEAGERYIDALEEYWTARTQLDLILEGSLTNLETESPQSKAGQR